MHRIVVIANKTWEVDPLIACLLHEKVRPAQLPLPTIVNSPRRASQSDTNPPRIIYKFGDDLQIEIWCIQDLMNPDPKLGSSNSEEKARVLPRIKEYGNIKADLVIAFGTASVPKSESYNGCVTIGTRMFVHDSHPDPADPKTNSHWKYDKCDQILDSPNSKPFFSGFDSQFRLNVESRLLTPPVNPAKYITIMVSPVQSGLSNINITDYNEYAWFDQQGVDKFNSNHFNTELVSVETTHGIIRAIFDDIPFIFLSGITDRVNYFNVEVAPRDYTQNFVAAHNAGIAVAWILPYLISIFAKDIPVTMEPILSSRHFLAKNVQPSRKSLTLSGVFSDMLLNAEKLYGKRKKKVTLAGIEFWDNSTPRVQYYSDSIEDFCVIQLPKYLMGDDKIADLYFQLAQEAMHFLFQSSFGTVLEEGLSIIFAIEYMRGDPFYVTFDPPTIGKYATAYQLTKKILDLDKAIITKLWALTQDMSMIAPKLIVKECILPCPSELATELCKSL